MGASEFFTRARGKTAAEAFRSAVQQARYEHGNGGYTGTIAEKSEFQEVKPKAGESVMECVNRHMDIGTFDDKWGPAGCVKIDDGEWYFFGFASE